ncbi:MAG: Hsp20/alpha crystallin family protein [Gammaproteobacteria bacterium]
MTIVRYEPWGLVNRFHNDIHRSLGRSFGRFFNDGESAAPANSAVAWLPSVDVREEENRFVVQVDLPGVDRGSTAKTSRSPRRKGVLTIKGERHSEAKKTEAGYERVERVAGGFLRRFTLPETAQAEGITAKQAKRRARSEHSQGRLRCSRSESRSRRPEAPVSFHAYGGRNGPRPSGVRPACVAGSGRINVMNCPALPSRALTAPRRASREGRDL